MSVPTRRFLRLLALLLLTQWVAGLPAHARVADKTGEISTVAHDAGIVYLPHRKPYVVAILSEWDPETTGRSPTIAAASYMVYEHLMGGRDEDDG